MTGQCSSSTFLVDNDTNRCPRLEDVSYDIPWEYVTGAAKHGHNNVPYHQQHQVEKQSATSTLRPSGTVQSVAFIDNALNGTNQATTSTVWHYRGPETDGRPQSEYDIPWNSKVLDQIKLCGSSAKNQRQSRGVHEKSPSLESSLSVHPQQTRILSTFLHAFKETRRCISKLEWNPALPSIERPKVPRCWPLCMDNEGQSSKLYNLCFSTNRAICKTSTGYVEESTCANSESLLSRTACEVRCNEPVSCFSTGRFQTNDSSNQHTGPQKFTLLESEKNLEGKLCKNSQPPPTPQYDTPCELCRKKKMNEMFEQRKSESVGIPGANLVKCDYNLISLDFGGAELNPSCEKLDVFLPLERQPWFHGYIIRNEAEMRLQNAIEGAFLVRICESDSRESALSLKSPEGYMHIKIQWNEQKNGWILGYFSQPFDSVPHMIRYYTINKLPIKGAEHMYLIKPVSYRSIYHLM